jgi:hypothetical protein
MEVLVWKYSIWQPCTVRCDKVGFLFLHWNISKNTYINKNLLVYQLHSF